jgi:hypothetical protein
MLEPKKAYWRVQATRDGIIWFAYQTRKPTKRGRQKEPEIDEDGICDWYYEPNDKNSERLTDWAKTLWHVSLATALNMKRTVRLQVSTRLDKIEKALEAVQEQLSRIERAMEVSRNKS